MSDKFDWSPFVNSGGGDFVKFENVGDEIVGQIVEIRTHTFDEKKGPVVLVDMRPQAGGDLVTLAVDKVDLRVKVAQLSPQVGDLLAAKFTGTEKTPNGTKKVFAVKHKRAEPADPFEVAAAEEQANVDALYDAGEEPFTEDVF